MGGGHDGAGMGEEWRSKRDAQSSRRSRWLMAVKRNGGGEIQFMSGENLYQVLDLENNFTCASCPAAQESVSSSL